MAIVAFTHTAYFMAGAKSCHATLERQGFPAPVSERVELQLPDRQHVELSIDNAWHAYTNACEELMMLDTIMSNS